MLETLADPKNPGCDSMKEWIGEEWDADRFDMDEANARLKRLKV
jgi:hypothetical protein